jgi:hypothetical protein
MARRDEGIGLLRTTGAQCSVREGASASPEIEESPTSMLDASGGAARLSDGRIRSWIPRHSAAASFAGVLVTTI